MNSPAPVDPLRLRTAPLLLAALAFAVGILTARELPFTTHLLTAALLLLLLLALAQHFAPRTVFAPALALWLIAGCWCAQLEPWNLPTPQLLADSDGLQREVHGRIERIRLLPHTSTTSTTELQPWQLEPGEWEPDTTPPTVSLDLALDHIEELTPDVSTMAPVTGGLRVTLTGTAPALHCGDELTFTTRLRPPDTFRTPGAFDEAAWLRSQNIHATGTAKSATLKVTGHHRAGLRCTYFRLQSLASDRLRQLAATPSTLPAWLRLSPDDAAMLSATLFGDRTDLTHPLRTSFEATGTFHLFVVSGLHVGLITAGLYWLLRRMRFSEVPAALLTIALAAAYALLCGFGEPVQRALIMSASYLLARVLDRDSTPLNALGAAALLMLIVDPRALTSASFQMTTLVILAITAVALPLDERWLAPRRRALDDLDIIDIDAALDPRLAAMRVRLRMFEQLLERLRFGIFARLPRFTARALHYLAEALLITTCAELVMVLPMAVHFHRITLLGLPLNALLIPLLAVLLALGAVTFAAACISIKLAYVPAALTALALHLVRLPVVLASRFPLSTLRIPAPPPPAIAAALALLTLAILLLHRPRRILLLSGMTALLAACTLALWPWPAQFHPGRLELTAIDVGQGDSLLVVTPDGHTLLIDAGGPVGRGPQHSPSSFDYGEQVIAPYLWSRGIRRLDAVALTHAHSDHMGGLAAVLDDLRPRELWLSPPPATSPDLTHVLDHARSRHIEPLILSAGDALTWHDVSIYALAPEPTRTNFGAPANDDSLVLRITAHNASLLLEGDAEADSEAAMLANQRITPVTVLKVGHHGSRTSTTQPFLDAASPHDALISVGRHNTFGHPRSEVLGRLEAAHVRTFRTDRNGTTTLLIDPTGHITQP